MSLIRAMFLVLAVTLPASWTLAHAGDEGAAGAGGESKEGKKSKKKGKKEGGEAGKGAAEMKTK